jgi:hypothetical protein
VWAKDFVQSTTKKISVLYLDNFDWNWDCADNNNTMIADQLLFYKKHNLTMNNLNCQTEHLMQMVNLMPAMANNSVVCIDDTYLNNETYTGKGGAVVPYLLGNGYKIMQTSDYGVILGCNKT